MSAILKTKERERLWWNFQTFGISIKPLMCFVQDIQKNSGMYNLREIH